MVDSRATFSGSALPSAPPAQVLVLTAVANPLDQSEVVFTFDGPLDASEIALADWDVDAVNPSSASNVTASAILMEGFVDPSIGAGWNYLGSNPLIGHPQSGTVI